VAGVPTVGTAVGHLAEWSPAAALTVAPGDVAGLAAAIQRVLDDESFRLALARDCQQRALAQDAAHSARLFEDLYQDAILRYRRI
jgi:glycosyltransferase involved in cell wall biosynthesis